METLQTSNLPSLLFIAGIIVVALITIGLIFAKLYTRATKETAFVRTGLGGEKVIKDGGAIVLPVVHEIIPVNMNTLRIEVEKTQKDALITKDRMRVDVKADFYLRVAPNSAGISIINRMATVANAILNQKFASLSKISNIYTVIKL